MSPPEQESGEGFLRRWSRLKRQGEPPDVPEPVVEEEIAVPPPADTIPLEEIGAWLSKRLPEGWREVALRRVWSADAAIRDHVGLADYAWDFTVPDGVPGWGPLTAADDLARLLARAIGEAEEEPEPEASPEEVAVEPAPQDDKPADPSV
jgi:hypothetical protein